MNAYPDRDKNAVSIALILGVFSFAVILAYCNLADVDLWARLVQGSSVWNTGHLIHKDVFAFTPVLPRYIDHEWGAGLIFFSLLRLFGPVSLLLFKTATAIGALLLAMSAGRLKGCKWTTLLFLAIPCAVTIFPAYIVVVRSHVITYLLFAATILCLEAMLRGRKWCAWIIIALMIAWVNTHGGFVAGLGVIGIYAIVAAISKKTPLIFMATMAASLLVSFINPYGAGLWQYLVPALLNPRADIAEWAPMAVLGMDVFIGFRVLFVIAVCAIILGWSNDKLRRSPQSIILLALTAYLAMRHRRHAPFFGLAACAFLGAYLESACARAASRVPSFLKNRINPLAAGIITYAAIALIVVSCVLPGVSFRVLAPAGYYPVREADILMYARAEGNIVTPLRWGNYIMWRLYPRIKISMCGRYEAMYPESTSEMDRAFFSKSGRDWDRIVREHKVDYILLQPDNTRIRPSDLNKLDYELVWGDDYSALYARKELAPFLRKIASNLPPITIDPLDAHIPDTW